MKGFFVIALIAVLVFAAVSAAPADEVTPKKCRDSCTYELSPVCGYDNSCYQVYPNKCIYTMEKCKLKSNLETVDMSLCDLATKDNHPDYKTCH